MKKHLYRAALVLLLITVLLIGCCWLYAEQILDAVARPQIEKMAGRKLGVTVQIGQMAWIEGRLEIHHLRIDAPQQGVVSIPRLALDFTLGSLWQRQLNALHIDSPTVEIFPGQRTGPPQKTPPKIPEKLPLTIKRLTVAEGQLLFQLAERQLEFHHLNISAALQPKSNFQLAAYFGPGENQPVAIDGTVELLPQQVLTLQNLAWQNQQLFSSPLTIQLAETGPALGDSTIRLGHFDDEKLQAILTALDQPSPLPAALSFSLAEATLGFALQDQRLTLELELADILISWNQLDINMTSLSLRLIQQRDGWLFDGQLLGPADTRVYFVANLDTEKRLTGQAQAKIPTASRLKSELIGGPALPIAGGLQLALQYSLQENRLELATDIRGQSPERSQSDYLLNLGELSGQGKLLLNGAKERLSLDLQLASQPFFSAAGDFQQLEFTLTAADLPTIKKLLAPGTIPAQLQTADRLKATGNLSKQAARWAGNIHLTANQLELSGLSLSGLEARTRLQLATESIDFSATSFATEISRGDELSAQLQIKGSGRYSSQRLALNLQQLELTQLNYLSPDEQTGIGEASLKLRGTINGPWPDGPLGLKLEGSVAAAEILAGEFYADLSAYQGDLSLAGDFNPTSGDLHAKAFKFDLPQLGTLNATGRLNPQSLKLQTRLEMIELAKSYGEHIGPLLSDIYPALTELTLEGQMALKAKLNWTPDGWQSNGNLQFNGLDAYWQRQQLEMVDGSGAIPFAISSGKPQPAAEATEEVTGAISFGSLSAGPATLEQGQLQLAASNNRFSFRSPLLLQLAGGRLTIKNLYLSWPGRQPQGSVDIDISEVDLQTLTEELDLPVMQGNLSADLGTLRYADRELSTDGLASIDVFGGNFQIRNMRFRDPFSSYPIFFSDIAFSGIDLLQATRTFDFGEMNGLLDGHIHGLKLFGSTPAAFSAVVSTRDEGKRNISVKALNNLSILSQGGISAALSRGIYRFINFYRYRMIGFECSLENDTFTLLGTAFPGSKRYLVHGGLLPPRIDITTTTPTISFKEMLNRLGRIERAGS